jgi:hypothetical protein
MDQACFKKKEEEKGTNHLMRSWITKVYCSSNISGAIPAHLTLSLMYQYKFLIGVVKTL